MQEYKVRSKSIKIEAESTKIEMNKEWKISWHSITQDELNCW